MAAFSLTKNGKTFDFDLSGDVKRNGAAIGKWSTSNDGKNRIVVTEAAGAVTDFSVGWRFNQHNQLELLNDNAPLFNFHGQAGLLPVYRMEDASLRITPDRTQSFTFPLNGEWKLDNKFDMTVTFGDVSSTIDGYVEDNRSRFIYKFFPKQGDLEIYQLVFAGAWTGKNEDGKYIMTFGYTRNGEDRSFKLPESVMFDKSINQLVFDYEKNGVKRRLQFVGELKISPKFVISYKFDRQQAGTGKELVASTTIAIQATFDMEQFKSKFDLSFALMKTDGVTPGTKLVIGGVFERDLQSGKLKLAFAYTYEKTGGVVKTNRFKLSGALKLKDDVTLIFEFSKDIAARSMRVAFAADQFRLGEFTGNVAVSVATEDGRLKEVHVLFGFSF